MNYLWHVLIMLGIYATLGASLNVITGYTGLVSLCHAAFFAIGAYTTALLMLKVGLGFFGALILAVAVAATVSLIVSAPGVRLHGDDFVLATLGFQVIIYSCLYNLVSVTGGPNGIPGVPLITMGDVSPSSPLGYLVFSYALLGGVMAILWLIVHSPFGRALRAVRDDELAAASIGKNVPRLKMTAFAISAGIAAVSGAVFATYMRYVDPSTFTTMEAIFILSIVIVGGAGRYVGPFAGAALLVLLPESLRFLQLPVSVAANLRQILYGFLLLLFMRFRPKGLFGDYDFK
jgi:branched-chain amino acid transport system permease protein